jgi:hypothetical protein
VAQRENGLGRKTLGGRRGERAAIHPRPRGGSCAKRAGLFGSIIGPECRVRLSAHGVSGILRRKDSGWCPSCHRSGARGWCRVVPGDLSGRLRLNCEQRLQMSTAAPCRRKPADAR